MNHDDIAMLGEVVDCYAAMDDEDPRMNARAYAAFVEMKGRQERGARSLTEAQRAWLRGIHERLIGTPSYENAWSAGKIPTGKEVPTPKVLQNLPKLPPGRIK